MAYNSRPLRKLHDYTAADTGHEVHFFFHPDLPDIMTQTGSKIRRQEEAPFASLKDSLRILPGTLSVP